MRKSVLLAGAIVATGLFLYIGYAKANQDSWIDSSDIRFTEISNPNEQYLYPSSLIGDTTSIYCNYQDIVTKPATKQLFLTITPEQKTRLCAVNTIYGTTDGRTLLRGGTEVGGILHLRSNSEWLLPSNNQNVAIAYDNSGTPAGSAYLNYSDTLKENIETILNQDKTVKHIIKNNGGFHPFKNSQNQHLQIRLSTATYSSNGNWLFFDSPFFGLIRINVITKEILQFGSPTNYNRSDPRYTTAISADGRYAIVTSQGRLDIYDLGSCIDQQGSLSYLKKCNVRSIEQERKAKTNFGTIATKVRFTSDKSFVYYTAERNGDVLNRKLYQVSIGDVPAYGFDYLGLGDSFASGEGAYEYKAITDNPGNMCHVSLYSYPYLIGSVLQKHSYESIACSGAKSDDVYQQNNSNYLGQYQDGIKELDRDKGSIISLFLPGKITQKSLSDLIRPETITISIGGNDIGFADKLTDCIVNPIDQTCFETQEDRLEVAEEINAIVPRLIQTFTALKEQNRRVYVIGYPQIVAPDGNCANNVKLNASEVDFAIGATTMLNNAVEKAAALSGVVYVNVENILDGKKLCEVNSADNLVHGITQGKDTGPAGIKILAKESYHPKVGAHELYKQAILTQTNNLTNLMPDSSPNFGNIMLEIHDHFWGSQSSGRSLLKPKKVEISDEVVKNQAMSVDIPTDIVFKPNSQVRAELHSQPTLIGTYNTNQSGELGFQFTIPSDIEPGFHSLHLYGQDLTGHPIDVYDYFFIRETADDFDGDGIKDNAEGCVLVEPSGMDADKDTIDDACDSEVISKFEEVPEQTEEPEENNENSEEITQENQETEVTPLPGIVTVPGQKDGDFSNPETVAGDEEIIPIESSNNITQTPNFSVQPVSQNTSVITSTNLTNPVVAQSNTESDGEVLSVQTNESTDLNKPVEVEESKVTDTPTNTSVNNHAVYWWYLAGGAIAFIGLVVLILFLRRQ